MVKNTKRECCKNVSLAPEIEKTVYGEVYGSQICGNKSVQMI